MYLQSARKAYKSGAVETASPERLLVMLYDRLVRDLVEAEEALGRHEDYPAHQALLHAQDIVSELLASLDPDKWDGAKKMASIYNYLTERLIAANVKKDATIVRQCRTLVEPLRDAWHQAYQQVVGNRSPAPALAGAGM